MFVLCMLLKSCIMAFYCAVTAVIDDEEKRKKREGEKNEVLLSVCMP